MLTCVCQVTDMFTDLPLSWAASPGSCRKQLQNFEEKASRGPQMMTWSKRCQTMYIIWIKNIICTIYIMYTYVLYIYYVYCILYWLIAVHKSMYIYIYTSWNMECHPNWRSYFSEGSRGHPAALWLCNIPSNKQ